MTGADEEIADSRERWPVASSAMIAAGNIVRVRSDDVRMPDGAVAPREVVEHPGAVAVVALDERNRVLLIRQYRHPVGALLWELPAGLRDVDGEPPEVTAGRELLEEAGYRAADWRVLADFFTSPGISNERLRVYLARELTEVPAGERDFVPEHEEAQLSLAWVRLGRAALGVLRGDLHNGVTAVGILAAYAAWRDDGRGGFADLRKVSAPEGP